MKLFGKSIHVLFDAKMKNRKKILGRLGVSYLESYVLNTTYLTI